MNELLVVSNLVFLPIENKDANIAPKYLKSNVYGSIMSFTVYTKEEVLSRWPDAKECRSLIEFEKVWNK